MASQFEAPYFPVVYVRGYAFSQHEVNTTSEDPYMGFNIGSTKRRQQVSGEVERHIFEGPLVRLMKAYHYTDIYADGSEALGDIPPRSIIVYRYYETADTDIGRPSLSQLFIGDIGSARVMEERALGLADLIHKIRDGVCQKDEERERWFRVHLVAHSMGGLICRCLLQKYGDRVRNAQNLSMVHKLFTYATPHNGIEILGLRNAVPAYFRHSAMRRYLKLVDDRGKPLEGDVNILNKTFHESRVFCLVGTNWRDYPAAFGWSKVAAGEMSDGLVKIKNATVRGAPRAFVHRSHSGPHGLVNSEEGYQNLARFLFGHMSVDGRLTVKSLPPSPGLDYSYYTEVTVAIAGTSEVNLTERKKDHWSAVFRTANQFGSARDQTNPLFSVYFPGEGPNADSARFTIDLTLSRSVPAVEGRRAPDRHLPNFFLFRKTLLVSIDADLNVRYWSDEESTGDTDETGHTLPLIASAEDSTSALIDLSAGNGFAGTLELRISRSHDETGGSRTARDSGDLQRRGGGAIESPMAPPVLELESDKAAIDDLDEYPEKQEEEQQAEEEQKPEEV
jgi:pimeloyl-ACP methyl ester carboxylesterase